jgi:hypothetical protein
MLYVFSAHSVQLEFPPKPAAHPFAVMRALSKRVFAVVRVVVAPEKVATQQTVLPEFSAAVPAGRAAVNWDDAAPAAVG